MFIAKQIELRKTKQPLNQIDPLPPDCDPEHTGSMDTYRDYFDRGSSLETLPKSAPASPSASSIIEARHCKELIQKLYMLCKCFDKIAQCLCHHYG